MPDALLDEILEEIEHKEPECTRCGRPMVSKDHWRRADAEERRDLWLDGYEAYSGGVQGATARCNPCSRQTGPLRDDELDVRDARRHRHLHYIQLRDQGLSRREIAEELGITFDGLRRNIINWKNRGWL